jgi:hypothetical protein
MFQPQVELSGASGFFFDQSRGVADQMGQTFLLRHAFQFLRIVTLPSVTDHDARKIGGNHYPDLFITIPRPDLIRRIPSHPTRHPVSSVCTTGCCDTERRKTSYLMAFVNPSLSI